MKRISTLIIMIVACLSMAEANDGVYFTDGNFLVPTKESDISVQKEILTITIGNDSIATVDVYYEFMNHGDAKTVTMAFEADASYCAFAKLNRNGGHPFIKSFTVNMNGKPLPYDNKVVAIRHTDNGREVDYTPLDLTKWKGYGEVADTILPYDDGIYNAELDSAVDFAYGYFFTAPFKAGLNTVLHTYSFQMSYRVGEKFVVPYWLTPATRWANHQVDDFTLRIKSDRAFCMVDSVFASAPFRFVGGSGVFYQTKVENGKHYLFMSSMAPDAVLEWHKTNFCPKANMSIDDAAGLLMIWGNSAKVVIDAEGQEYRYIGDCGDTYLVSAQDYGTISKKGCKVVEYSVDNGKGWVFPRNPGTYNVRTAPSTKSSIIGKIKYEEGMLPDTYRCLGLKQTKDKDQWGWYKIQFGNRIGYVSDDYMEWDAINTF